MSARDDGLVREEKNNRVVSREDTTELTEIEDVRHYGDFSDAVSTFFYDYMTMVCNKMLSPIMISMKLVQTSTKSLNSHNCASFKT